MIDPGVPRLTRALRPLHLTRGGQPTGLPGWWRVHCAVTNCSSCSLRKQEAPAARWLTQAQCWRVRECAPSRRITALSHILPIHLPQIDFLLQGLCADCESAYSFIFQIRAVRLIYTVHAMSGFKLATGPNL